ncbi:MAG TPA: ABC transporter substrate-binding protein [Candidatus Paceibacterota bacterium]
MRKTIRIASLIIAVCLGLANNASSAAKLDEITVNIVAGVESNAILHIGQEKGIFEKYGLRVNLLISNNRIAALESGSAQFSLGSVSDMTVRTYLAGSDIRIIASLDERLDYRLVAHKDVLRNGLKGQTVIVPFALTQIVGIAAKITAESLGLDSEKDLNYVSVPSFPDVTLYLVNGRAKVGMLNAVYAYKALRANPNLMVFAEFNREYPLSSVAAKESYLRANPDATKRFLMAIAETLVYFKNNEAETKKLIADKFGHKDPDLINLIYDYYKKTMGARLNLHPKSHLLEVAREFVMRSQPQATSIDVSRLINRSFLDELENNGFLPNLRLQQGGN